MTKTKLFSFIALIIIIPLGFYSKFYTGTASYWVNNSLGGVFYEIFWCVLIFLFFTKFKPIIIAFVVLVITCALEFTQLWKPQFLEMLRENFIIRTIIGNTFTWNDFTYYIIGSFAGFALIVLIKRMSEK
ncbi:MAG: DUF2809 domain-containing protein [Candidatus Cloacimonetes bacterium]|nr:DUF2809 domain-containing protein [Candidatus Cloacimonadota bacterium]